MKKIQGKAPPIWPLVVALATSLTAACGPQPAPVPPSSTDAGDEHEGAAPVTCASWCAHARALGCSSAKPTRAGASCEEVCGNVQTGPAKWNLRCRSAAASCAAADVCEH